MKNPSIPRAVLCLSLPLLVTSCHPHHDDPVPEAITCPSMPEVYAYRGIHNDTVFAPYSCIFGMINTSTGASTSMASSMNRVYFNQGAFHISENTYYTFKSMDTARTLLKIDMSGTVTPLSNTSFGDRFDGLVYNRFNSKLYCFRVHNGSGLCHIAEVVVSGSSYTTSDVSTTLNVEMNDNATVDPATGDIYYQTGGGSPTTYNIEKCHPGGTASTICSGMALDISGLRYNANDHLLYAIRPGSSGGFEFVKINGSGAITALSSVPYVNTKFYSACIDPCNNHYILSYKALSTSTGHLYQMNMSGTMLQHDSAATMYQGLDVKY